MNTLRTVGIFLICIAASLLAGFWGSTGTVESIPGWYSTINKPFWTPPNWVFMPVWTLLFILMGTAAALVWKTGKKGVWMPVLFFFAHLAVNTYWSIAFFSNQDAVTALYVIALLWLMIVGMMVWFWRYSRLATYLLVPYLVWVSYASTLNVGIVLLNP
jgi:translocator protein